MKHDPISFIISLPCKTNFEIQVPRINGIVNGEEIPVKKGHYRHVGRIVFEKERMKMDLSYDNTDDLVKSPLSWNGDYILVRKRN